MYPDPDDHPPDAGAMGDSSFDVFGGDVFTREIENVSASDWDVDSDLLWGEPDAPDDPGADAIGADFPA